MRILFVEEDDGLRSLYVMVLENLIQDVSIVECISGNKAVDHLENFDFDLIICDYEMSDGNGDIVYNYLKELNKIIPFILFSTSLISKLSSYQDYMNHNPDSIYISKSVGVNGFKDKLFSFLSNTIESITFMEEVYKKVRIYNFWRFNRAMCDVYLKLSDKKYVKIINKMDYYSKKDIERYVRKKQKYFYITHDDYHDFGVTLKQASFLMFDEGRSFNKPKEEIVTLTHSLIHELLKNVGVSKTVLELTEKTVTNITGNIENDEILSLLVKTREKRDYMYDHCYLLSCICCNIFSKLSWYNSESFNGLCIAALYHDLALDNSELAMIENIDDESLLEFSTEDQKLYVEHPSIMAKILRDSGEFAENISEIIEQHHERIDGTGFPLGINHTKINPLLAVFILGHDLVERLYAIDFNELELRSQLMILQKKYNIGSFKKPLEVLIESFNL